jgi:UPF0716 protein FxsA
LANRLHLLQTRFANTFRQGPDGTCHTGDASALGTVYCFFLYVYIEISIFIQVAHVLGVLLTLILVIFTSVIGVSLVRNQGFKNFLLMQQKMAAGESPAAEMIKSVSLIIAGLLLILPGFFTDFLGLLLLLPPVQKHLTMKLLPHLRFSRMPGGGFSTGPGDTFEGEYQRKDEQNDRLDHKDDR